MNILLFGPFNYRSRDNESVLLKFKELGNRVFFLTELDGYLISEFLQKHGVACFKMNSFRKGKVDLIRRVFFLIRFIKEHKIDLVFSHLETSNVIAVLSQFFVKAKIVIVRHHVDEMHLNGQADSLSYKLTYQLARNIIAVSERARQFAIEKENVAPGKIDVIRLSYNFNLFDKPDSQSVKEIKDSFPCQLLLVTACRLVENKRPAVSIRVAENLMKAGVDVKLLILGAGKLEEELKSYIYSRSLQDSCYVLGFKQNIIDYLEASDVLLNPSVLDSSSVIIKEAGWRKKAVAVCKGVGDCDTYIENGSNGLLAGIDSFEAEVSAFLIKNSRDKSLLQKMGENLHGQILRLFDVDKNIQYYRKYLEG